MPTIDEISVDFTVQADEYNSGLQEIISNSQDAITTMADLKDVADQGNDTIANFGETVAGVNPDLLDYGDTIAGLADAQGNIIAPTQEAKAATEENAAAAKEANEKMSGLQEGLGGAIEKLTGFSLETLTAAGAIIGLAEGAKQAIDDFAEMGDKVKMMSIITGQSNEDVSKLIASMGMLGVSSDTVQSAMEFAIRKGFQPTIENLKDLADKFNATQDPVQRGQLLIQTFGRSAGPELADYLEKGSDGIQELIDKAVVIGDVMSDTDVEAADRYKEALGELQAQWEAAKRQGIEPLIPWLTELAGEFGDQISALEKVNDAEHNGGLIAGYKAIFDNLGPLLGLQEHEREVIETSSSSLANYTQILTIQQNAEDKATAATALANEAKGNVMAAQDLLNISTQKYTDLLLYQEAQKVLDPLAALKLGEALGVVDSKTVDAYSTMQDFNQQFIDGKITLQDYINKVLALQTAEDNLYDKTVTIDYRTVYTDTHTSTTTPTPGPNVPDVPQGAGDAWGGSFVIPAEYGFEGYSLGPGGTASGGEVVSVAPPGQQPGGTIINVTPHYYKGDEPTVSEEIQMLRLRYAL